MNTHDTYIFSNNNIWQKKYPTRYIINIDGRQTLFVFKIYKRMLSQNL